MPYEHAGPHPCSPGDQFLASRFLPGDQISTRERPGGLPHSVVKGDPIGLGLGTVVLATFQVCFLSVIRDSQSGFPGRVGK